MADHEGKKIVLAARPEGMPTAEHLQEERLEVPRPGEGEMLLRTLYLSLDPYMRGRMSAAKSYAAPVEIGGVMEGATVCEVVESRLDGYQPGEYVLAGAGWQTHAVSNGKGVRKLDPAKAPLTTALGVMGMPGFTAYAGLLELGQPRSGETVVVSAASGAVGQVVGQIARLKGCRVVGIAGADDKCAYVTDELGFDAAVNYKSEDFRDRLAEACPDGIDVYFENVGGKVLAAVLPNLNEFSRMPVCGLIAHYNDTSAPEGPDRLPGFMRTVLAKRVMVRGFIQFDFAPLMPDFVRDMSGWLADGSVRYREDVVQGLENAVDAFQGLLEGRNRGKLIVQVGEDPTR
ncbi:MAG: NADP-dependent oxidoreductase [Alteromonadaceae bacterium]|nr:NADP-dependent oxidoreductase [Alteromonadaceae bacterium]